MPKLWTDTVEAHRNAVREASLETTAALVAEHGVRHVTMSQIADEVGIARATLYKYFSDVETILVAWHERQIGAHLEQLAHVSEQTKNPSRRLAAVLATYAVITRDQSEGELADLLHRGEHVARAREHLRNFIRELIADAARAGDVRGDVPPDELAAYCLHALTASSSLPSKAAVRRLVDVTLAGLRPPR